MQFYHMCSFTEDIDLVKTIVSIHMSNDTGQPLFLIGYCCVFVAMLWSGLGPTIMYFQASSDPELWPLVCICSHALIQAWCHYYVFAAMLRFRRVITIVYLQWYMWPLLICSDYVWLLMCIWSHPLIWACENYVFASLLWSRCVSTIVYLQQCFDLGLLLLL